MRIVIWLLVAAALVWIWQNPDQVRTFGEKAQQWIGSQSRAVADKLAPQPGSQDKEGAAPSAPAMAEGIYVLKQNFTFAGTGGSISWRAGTELREVGRGNGKSVVTDGVNQTSVDSSALTREPTEIAAVREQIRKQAEENMRQNVHAIELELREIDAKIPTLQAELKRIQMVKLRGGPPQFGTDENFLHLSIQRLEARKSTLNQMLSKAHSSR